MEYARVEPVAEIRLSIHEGTVPTPMTRASARRVLNFWMLAPSNVTRMSPDLKGLPESSISFTVCRTDQDQVIASSLGRSSRATQFLDMRLHIEALGDVVGAKVSHDDEFSGWLPQPDSCLVHRLRSSLVKLVGAEPMLESIHAGLECGDILKNFPGMEALSIGPDIRNPHTVQEELDVDSMVEVWNWLCIFLMDMKEKCAVCSSA